MIDRARFYNGVRSGPFPRRLKQSQVDGIEPVLDVWDRERFTDLRWLAYILATVFHETGARMTPVREGFASNDKIAREAVRRLHQKGRIRRDYAIPSHGFSWFGRGRVQNTHYANYVKLEKRFGHPFTTNPSLLLDSAIDAEVTVIGHVEGIWTGKKLADFLNLRTTDWLGARKIINGTDRAALIAGYAKEFHSDLVTSDSARLVA